MSDLFKDAGPQFDRGVAVRRAVLGNAQPSDDTRQDRLQRPLGCRDQVNVRGGDGWRSPPLRGGRPALKQGRHAMPGIEESGTREIASKTLVHRGATLLSWKNVEGSGLDVTAFSTNLTNKLYRTSNTDTYDSLLIRSTSLANRGYTD